MPWIEACLLVLQAKFFDWDEKALDRLVQGNKRFASDKLKHPNRTGIRREAIKTTQKPFAIILGCSDSRVSPEIIFDQWLGDLFIIRVARVMLSMLLV